jgi:hypothetical protein
MTMTYVIHARCPSAYRRAQIHRRELSVRDRGPKPDLMIKVLQLSNRVVVVPKMAKDFSEIIVIALERLLEKFEQIRPVEAPPFRLDQILDSIDISSPTAPR